jgi:hypothetical protein
MIKKKNFCYLFRKGSLLILMMMLGACRPPLIDSPDETLTPELVEMMPEIVNGSGGASSGGAQGSGQESEGGSTQNGQMNDYQQGESVKDHDLCAYVKDDSPCSNPYIPVVEGLRVQYSSADGEISQTIDEVENGGFKVTQIMPDGSSFSMDWECTPEGLKGFTAQDQLQGMLADFGGAYSDIEIDGVALPAGVSVGDAWVMNVRIIVGVAQSGVDSRNTIDLELNFSAISEDTISVPAGSFRALRVDYTTQGVNNLEITAPAGVFTQQLAVIEGSGSDWYVECLGRVKSISTSVVTGIADYRDERTMELSDFRLSD